MIVTPDFVFIHLHRTGGRFIRSLLLDYLPGSREIGYHFPASLIPQSCRDLPVVGFVRNPWDWYVSWYAFNRVQPRSVIFSVASNDGQLDFNSTVMNLLQLGSDSQHCRTLRSRMMERLPDSIIGNRGAGITRGDLAAFSDGQTGYYSWLVQRMFCGVEPAQLRLGKFENLREELLRIWRELGVQLPPALESAIYRTDRTNASARDRIDTHYSSEVLAAVRQQEEWVCRRFDYAAPPACGELAVCGQE